MKQQIDGHTRLLGVMGNPIAHTLSPVIHNTLSELRGKNQVYVPFPVAADELEQAVRGAYALDLLGLNVTVPYKNTIMDYLTGLDPAAEAIGAVNTLVRTKEGFQGYNTDMPGLLRALRSEGISIAGKKVVILGAGGASKAVAYMCMQERAEAVYILNRTLQKAQMIADSMNQLFSSSVMQPMSMQEIAGLPEGPFLVFQCTSLGLYPDNEAVVVEDSDFYRKIETGVDLIYNPAETRFMRLVKEAGGAAYNGLKMLLYQGIIAYELWNGLQITEEEAEIVYDRLYEAIHPPRDNIVLIGFMGSGKTTVGHQLEQQYGYTFLDTDTYIEEQEGKSITRIFDEEGEMYFRQLEQNVLRKLITDTSHAVISTGGGMPLQRENARLLRELGQVYYLAVSEEAVWKRVRNSHDRPLLECERPRERIHELLTVRQPVYQQAAHRQIVTVGRTIEEITAEIYAYRTGWKQNEDISNQRAES